MGLLFNSKKRETFTPTRRALKSTQWLTTVKKERLSMFKSCPTEFCSTIDVSMTMFFHLSSPAHCSQLTHCPHCPESCPITGGIWLELQPEGVAIWPEGWGQMAAAVLPYEVRLFCVAITDLTKWDSSLSGCRPVTLGPLCLSVFGAFWTQKVQE